MVDTTSRSPKAVQGMSRRQPRAAWLCGRVCYVGVLGEEVGGGGMCVLNVLGRGLLMEAWEGVCSRVWSAGAKREREPGEEAEEEGFYRVPEHPLNQVKSPAARELDPLCGNRAAPPKWLLASNPTPGCRSDVFPMKGGAQPLDFHHTLIQAFSQLLTFWPVHCGHRTVRIGRKLREKKACGLEIQSGCRSTIRG